MKLKLLSKLMKTALVALTVCVAAFSTQAQTTLTQGDIAFIGYNADGVDSFTFVITRTAGIASGTVINFTDNGWLGTVNCGVANHFNTLETVETWTATSAMNYLDVVTLSSGYASAGSISGNPLSLATGGDQIFAFQGAFNSAAAVIIAGIHMNGNWDANSTSSTTSAKPNCLTDGVNVVYCDPEVDNASYDCSVLSGTRATILAAINGSPIDNGISSNWITDNASSVGHPSCSFAAASTTWNGATWSNGAPSASVDAIIASSVSPGNFTCKNMTINNGFALVFASSQVVNINGDVTNNGLGFVAVNNTGVANFAITGELTGNNHSFAGTVTVASGATLTTNSKLTLTSTSSNTGRIGNSAGTISGNVTVQRHIPGKRAFRYLAHPFTTTQQVSILTDDIDITGSGGAGNGFTTTTTNNPSAFIWNVATADNSTAGSNPGWSAITSATSSSWTKAGLLRVLVRGAKGEGLSASAYTPSASTIDMIGTVNQGTQVITLTKGASSTFVGCGNPFPSAVQMNTVAKGSNVGANYYVWDATSGAKGAYVTNPFANSYILPAGAAFFTTVSANSNNTLTFEEADKSSSTPASIFKTTAAKDWVELLISDTSLRWDRLLINFNDNSMEAQDKLDAVKLYNPGLDFFTLSKDGERLAVDVRPYTDKSSIPLGLTAYNRYNKYVIRTGDYSVPAGTKLVLHDKYLNKTQELKSGFEYWFDVTSDTLSQGNNRFEINMVGVPTSIINATNNGAKIQLVPNPARNEVKVVFHKLDGKAQVRLMTVTGQVVYAQEVNTTTGGLTIPLTDMPVGMYIVELQSKNARFIEKLIKE